MNNHTAYISLGGNLGGEEGLFSLALRRMAALPGVKVTARSRLYQTEPHGDPDQPWFVNMIASLLCTPTWSPRTFLAAILEIETALGRKRDASRQFGPRCIDLDLLLFGDILLTEDTVTVPHPRMVERAFVLVPLLEIAPRLTMPGSGIPVTALLARLSYRVEKGLIHQDNQEKRNMHA